MLKLIVAVCLCTVLGAEPLPNTLTVQELAEGWQLLFDGQTLNGWRGIKRVDAPACWRVIDGALVVNAKGKINIDRGDLITERTFGDFELAFEWRMDDRGGNSGVKYYVLEELSSVLGGIGLEYQIQDDAGAGNPQPYHRVAALYELYPAEGAVAGPLGEWNHSRIVSRQKHVEHWLNGVKVLEYERGGNDFRLRVIKSKFSRVPQFGEAEAGHILLQQHGSTVAFRSIKVRPL